MSLQDAAMCALSVRGRGMTGPVKGAVLQLFKGLSGVWAPVDAQPHTWDPIPGRTSRGLGLTGISKGPLEIFDPP